MAGATVEGHCLCGDIVFECDANPKWTVHCHCETCRRANSAPVTTWSCVPLQSFRFKQGTPRYFNSSPGVRRGFCGNCGSPLVYQNERWPGEIHYCAVALADSSQVTPGRHVFVAEQLPWFETADDLPRFAATSVGGTQPVRHGAKPK